MYKNENDITLKNDQTFEHLVWMTKKDAYYLSEFIIKFLESKQRGKKRFVFSKNELGYSDEIDLIDEPVYVADFQGSVNLVELIIEMCGGYGDNGYQILEVIRDLELIWEPEESQDIFKEGGYDPKENGNNFGILNVI